MDTTWLSEKKIRFVFTQRLRDIVSSFKMEAASVHVMVMYVLLEPLSMCYQKFVANKNPRVFEGAQGKLLWGG